MPDTFIPKEQLSAYERWEIGSLTEPHGKTGGGHAVEEAEHERRGHG